MSAKFFSLPNLATDAVTVVEKPWEIKVPDEVLDLPKEEYKKRWFNPETRHHLLLLAQGMNEAFCVSAGNQASVLYGFMADYDGVFTPDIVEATMRKPPSRWKPAWWCLSQSRCLHLVWLFERPVVVTGNAHANALIHMVATKLKAVRWGVGYDVECETVTQVMDIGREWHVYKEGSVIPSSDLVAWDMTLFEKSVRDIVSDVVDIPMEAVAAEVARRQWPHEPPRDFREGVRCLRFWDPAADNATAAQVTKAGVRVYTPHDNGFVSWKSLLGQEFCEEYTSKSLAPFYEDTTYNAKKDTYYRFFRDDVPPHYEPRTEKVLRRDLIQEARLAVKPAKGETLSELDNALYNITRRNSVEWVAPIIYRPTGRISLKGVGRVLNTSLVHVHKPAERLASVTAEDVAAHPDAPQEYVADPSLCEWDNPFAVANFPHIHRFLTTLFIPTERIRMGWEARGYSFVQNGGTFAPLKSRQLVRLVSWMSHFYRHAARMSSEPSRGQALILAGKTGRGKSFFARQILGRLMGGFKDAEDFYLRAGRFNSDIIQYPVHLIDDQLGSRTHKVRLAFTESLKTVVANASLRYEQKFGSAVESVPWAGRVVILCNEDPQSLSVLPDLDMSTRDKFMMLMLGDAQYPFGADEENQQWLARELPYFARFLLGWRIPADMRDVRFGVAAEQHPDMVQASAENGLTQVLVEVLETVIEAKAGERDEQDRSDADGYVIEGNAVKIFRWIAEHDASLARELIDSRVLNQTLMTLYRNGGYNIVLDSENRRWRIPYVLRRKAGPST
jgi:hypothetical protein